MSEKLDCAIIGGGVIGLAVARRLALLGRHVVLFEAEKATGQHTSSRNSEVMHAGIYYPTGSLKARLCVEGRRMLEAYCAERGVAWRRIGKLVVAVRDEEIAELERHQAQAAANGVEGIAWLERDEVARLEPAVTCVRALSSPATGLVDSHGLMRALAADARRAGADIVVSSPVVGGEIVGRRHRPRRRRSGSRAIPVCHGGQRRRILGAGRCPLCCAGSTARPFPRPTSRAATTSPCPARRRSGA